MRSSDAEDVRKGDGIHTKIGLHCVLLGAWVMFDPITTSKRFTCHGILCTHTHTIYTLDMPPEEEISKLISARPSSHLLFSIHSLKLFSQRWMQMFFFLPNLQYRFTHQLNGKMNQWPGVLCGVAAFEAPTTTTPKERET